MIFGVEKLIFGQKSRKRYWTLIFYFKLSVYKTASGMFRTLRAFKTRELVMILMNDCFAIQRYRALIIIILFISI